MGAEDNIERVYLVPGTGLVRPRPDLGGLLAIVYTPEDGVQVVDQFESRLYLDPTAAIDVPRLRLTSFDAEHVAVWRDQQEWLGTHLGILAPTRTLEGLELAAYLNMLGQKLFSPVELEAALAHAVYCAAATRESRWVSAAEDEDLLVVARPPLCVPTALSKPTQRAFDALGRQLDYYVVAWAGRLSLYPDRSEHLYADEASRLASWAMHARGVPAEEQLVDWQESMWPESSAGSDGDPRWQWRPAPRMMGYASERIRAYLEATELDWGLVHLAALVGLRLLSMPADDEYSALLSAFVAWRSAATKDARGAPPIVALPWNIKGRLALEVAMLPALDFDTPQRRGEILALFRTLRASGCNPRLARYPLREWPATATMVPEILGPETWELVSYQGEEFWTADPPADCPVEDRVRGWGVRLQMPGYIDATDWVVAPNLLDLIDELIRMYDDAQPWDE